MLVSNIGYQTQGDVNILNMSPQALANLCSRLAYKLFKIDGGTKDFDNMLCNLG
jgi:hypothetical protein